MKRERINPRGRDEAGEAMNPGRMDQTMAMWKSADAILDRTKLKR